MALRVLLSSDTHTNTASGTGGAIYDEELFTFAFLSETSVHGASAQNISLAGPMKANGVIADFFIGVGDLAVSASGFVTGDVSATLRVNSVACLSTAPALKAPILSAAVTPYRTNVVVSTNVSAVVNTASAAFSTGDLLSIDYNAVSAGSAAAGRSGKGFYACAKVRYNAI